MKIGQDVEKDEIVDIDDIPRQSGLYILGKPGMGKSNLIELSVLSDISDGVFFLDPHGDSIDKIIKYLKPSRQKIGLPLINFVKMPDGTYMCTPRYANENTPVRIINPEDEEYSFGINPLSCNDLTSLKERTDTYTRAYNVFYKIWEEDWGVWLQLIVQNTLYVFLENPDYTLADVPLFFTNENFRRHLVNNVKYNLDVKDFWLTRFESKREYDQQRQVDAALTRISILLGHPYIKHIIGQTKSKLDFSKVMAKKEIIFLKLSAALSPDIKKFIGMIVIGELLHHVRRRPTDKRDLFSVFIDEFQNFATSDDLATFITEARKFGIATTIAHQERLGQLGDNKKMMGATLVAANKVYFQLTIKDAEELAGEFARDPPPEIRLEEKFAVSQNPVLDLLRGHDNPEVRVIVEDYIRPVKDRISDIRGEAEAERLIRTDYMDDANLLRLDAQIANVDYRSANTRALRGRLRMAQNAIDYAQQQTEKLKGLNEQAQALRRMLREINKFLVNTMEGKTKLCDKAIC